MKEVLNNQENYINSLNNQTNIDNEKLEAITHKDNALKRLDSSFNKHIELAEYKKSNILSYWIEDFSNYHDNEKFFDYSSLKIFKRGDIIKANLGFNIGNELGGLHYCIVLDKKDNPYNGTLNIVPLSSAKEDKVFNPKTCINLGDELYLLIDKKLKNEINNIKNRLQSLNSSITNTLNKSLDIDKTAEEVNFISNRVKYLNKMEKELLKMKHGSFALVNQITTISKQRIYKTPILSGIKLSNNSLDLIDSKIISMFTK